MHPTRTSNRASVWLVLMMLSLTAACGGKTDGDIACGESPIAVDVATDLGEPVSLTLLPGSTGNANGSRLYLLRIAGRELTVSRTILDDGAAYLEVHEGAALLAAAEVKPGHAVLWGPSGRWLFSTAGALPIDEAAIVVDPLVLRLLDEKTLWAIEPSVWKCRKNIDLSALGSATLFGISLCTNRAEACSTATVQSASCCGIECTCKDGGVYCGMPRTVVPPLPPTRPAT